MSFPLPLVPARPDMFTLDEAVTRIRAALRVPRRKRIERRRWQEAAAAFDRFNGSTWISIDVVDFSSTPYLVVHPEREIAEVWSDLAWTCPACRASQSFFIASVFGTHGSAHAKAIAGAHRHNSARHPRRWLRSQHFQATIPDAVRERAAFEPLKDEGQPFTPLGYIVAPGRIMAEPSDA